MDKHGITTPVMDQDQVMEGNDSSVSNSSLSSQSHSQMSVSSLTRMDAGKSSGQGNPSQKSGASASNPFQTSPARGSEEGPSSTDAPGTSRTSKVPKFCGVCNDRAKSYHFGGLACDSCKAFFRRSVHNDAYTSFQCAYEGTCNITKNTRKGCQKCRFEKCLTIGMEKKWVMSEQERTALNKQRQDRKRQILSPSSSIDNISSGGGQRSTEPPLTPTEYDPNIDDMLKYMSIEEQKCIKQIVDDYHTSYKEIPYRVPKIDGPRNSIQVVDMFTTILRRFAFFSKLIPEFKRLCVEDQGNLLRASVLEMCLLRGALSFDVENHRWPNTSLEFLKNCPRLRVEDMENLVSQELYELHMNFIFRMQKLQVDEPTVMLLLLVVLFYPERSFVEDIETVSKAQEKYLILLQKYVNWRYGPKRGSLLYPQILSKLTDLRQLNDLHTEYHLKLAESDVNTIREHLSNLQLNPYPQWKIVEDQTPEPETEEVLQVVGSPEFPLQPTPPVTAVTGGVHFRSPPVRQQQQQQEQQQQHQQQQQQQFQLNRSPKAMAETFLKRIPALIEDPFAPMLSQGDMVRAREHLQHMQGPQAAHIREILTSSSMFTRFNPQDLSYTQVGGQIIGQGQGQPHTLTQLTPVGSQSSSSSGVVGTTGGFNVESFKAPQEVSAGGTGEVGGSSRNELKPIVGASRGSVIREPIRSVSQGPPRSSASLRREEEVQSIFRGGSDAGESAQEIYQRIQSQGYQHHLEAMEDTSPTESESSSSMGRSGHGPSEGGGGWQPTTIRSNSESQEEGSHSQEQQQSGQSDSPNTPPNPDPNDPWN